MPTTDSEHIVGELVDTEGETTAVVTRPRGRPSLCTPAMQRKLIAAIKENPSLGTAATTCGISYSTLNGWLKKGEEGDPRFEEFAVAFNAARSIHKNRLIKNMTDVAENSENDSARVNAARFLVSKLFPNEFGDKPLVDVTVKRESIVLTNVKTEDLVALSEIADRARLEPPAEDPEDG